MDAQRKENCSRKMLQKMVVNNLTILNTNQNCSRNCSSNGSCKGKCCGGCNNPVAEIAELTKHLSIESKSINRFNDRLFNNETSHSNHNVVRRSFLYVKSFSAVDPCNRDQKFRHDQGFSQHTPIWIKNFDQNVQLFNIKIQKQR